MPACQSPSSTTDSLPVVGNKVGNIAIDFALKDLNGNTVTLYSLLGKPVMLNFWALDCPYCLDEMPLLQTTYLNESSKTDGIVLLTVNMKDSTLAIKNYFNSKSFTLATLLDSGSKVTQTYGISGIPTTFFIDREGIIRHIKRGAFLSMAELQISLNRIN
jgi:peroxiredoxin